MTFGTLLTLFVVPTMHVDGAMARQVDGFAPSSARHRAADGVNRFSHREISRGAYCADANRRLDTETNFAGWTRKVTASSKSRMIEVVAPYHRAAFPSLR
jgi:hypothetical protein